MTEQSKEQIIKYVTKKWNNKIDKVFIKYETPKMVVLNNGIREYKQTDYHAYHNTWSDAKQHLLGRSQRAIKGLESALNEAKKDLVEVEALKDED